MTEIEDFEKFHPRAMKLLRKHKRFLVISESEPYFLLAYKMIRNHESRMGRWTLEDDAAYRDAEQRNGAAAGDTKKASCDAIEHDILISFDCKYCDQCGMPLFL